MTSVRVDWSVWIAVAFLAGAVFMHVIVMTPSVITCQEDEAWVTVDHHTIGAVEDEAGVSRLCVNMEELTT